MSNGVLTNGVLTNEVLTNEVIPDFSIIPEHIVRCEIIPYLGRKRFQICYNRHVGILGNTYYQTLIHAYDHSWQLYITVQIKYNENHSETRIDSLDIYRENVLDSCIVAGYPFLTGHIGRYMAELATLCKIMRKLGLVYVRERHIRWFLSSLLNSK